MKSSRSRSELRQEKQELLLPAGEYETRTQPKAIFYRDGQRDDEIRGLKAIIHSLNRDSMISTVAPGTNGHTNGYGHAVGDEKACHWSGRLKKELETLIERKAYREEELESEWTDAQLLCASTG